MRIVRALFHVSRTFRFSGRTKRTEQAGFILEEMELVTMCSGTNIFKFISGAAQAIKLNLLTHKLYGKRSKLLCIFFGAKGHFDDIILSRVGFLRNH